MFEVHLKRLRSYRAQLEAMNQENLDRLRKIQARALDTQAREIEVELGLLREKLRRNL